MVIPNSDSIVFCDWLTNSTFYRFSPQRLDLIAIVRAAAVAGTSVTTVQYNDFIRFTAHLYDAFNCWVNNSQINFYNFAMGRKIINYQNTDTDHTGDTNETILCSLFVPANSMTANSVIYLMSQVNKVGTAGICLWKYYAGITNNSLVGAAQLGLYSMPTATLWSTFSRYSANKNAINLNSWQTSNISNPNYFNLNTSARSILNLDWSINQYIIITCTLANAGDTARLGNIQVYIDKP